MSAIHAAYAMTRLITRRHALDGAFRFRCARAMTGLLARLSIRSASHYFALRCRRRYDTPPSFSFTCYADARTFVLLMRY